MSFIWRIGQWTRRNDKPDFAAPDYRLRHAKAATALIDVYERPSAPLHLLLGSDAVAMAETKLAQVRAEIAALRSFSVATDFEQRQATDG